MYEHYDVRVCSCRLPHLHEKKTVQGIDIKRYADMCVHALTCSPLKALSEELISFRVKQNN